MTRIFVSILLVFITSSLFAQERGLPCRDQANSQTRTNSSFVDSESSDSQASRRLAKLQKAKATDLYIGEKRGLVILVNFADLAMVSETAQADFDAQFNEEGYSKSGHVGSVSDYFYEQSYEQFRLRFDVVGPITVSQDMAYYGGNDGGSDQAVCTLVIEACKMVDELVDFSDYDWDGDNEVDQVFLIYAGYGENFTGVSEDAIWPHEWDLSSGKSYGDGTGALTLDGVKIDTYAMSCELYGKSGDQMDGIGMACHEFAHCLGYPDFYDTSYKGGWGMQAWDLMDSGCYNGPQALGEAPIGMTSYERWYAGWLEPTVLEDGMQINNMASLLDESEAYILYNPNDQNEYYMLENHQAERWFSYISGYAAPSGMMILHVDYSSSAWANNKPNNSASHQRMTLFLANDDPGTYKDSYYSIKKAQYAGHLYPYEGNDSLTAESTPAATVYNEDAAGNKYMALGIYNITQNADGTMSFYCGSSAPTTGIEMVESGRASEEFTIYDLSGRAVTAPARGLYIQNGRKVIIK